MSMLSNILPWFQAVVAVLLVLCIMIQQGGDGVGSAFGGAGGGGVAHTKRGLEKWLFMATIVLAILFVLASLFNLFV